MADPKRRSAFGVDVVEGVSEEELDSLFGEDAPPTDAPPAPEGEPQGEQPDAQPAEAEPEEKPAEEPEGEQPAAPAEEEAHVEEPTSEEEQRKWAQKFDSPEDLERSYISMQSMESRTRQQLLEATSRSQQLEDALRQALPMVQENDQLRQMVAQQRQGEGAEEFDTMDPRAMQSYIDQQVQAGIQAYLQQQAPYQNPAVPGQMPGQPMVDPNAQAAQAAWQQQFIARRDAAVEQFRKNHPQVTEGSAYDADMYRIVEGYGLDPSDLDQLEMAYDIWENPQAGSLLRAQPHLLATPEGRNLFRQNVRSAAPQGAPANGARPARQADPRTHVETGGTGAPVQAAPGERPSGKDPVTGKARDEFSDVLDDWDQVSKDRNARAFGF